MLFNSFEFIFLFLPICLLGYYALARYVAPRWALGWLFSASVFFYAYLDWHFAALFGLSLVGNFFLARLIRRTRSRWVFGLGVTANLLVLAYFKYADFFINNLNTAFHLQWVEWHVVLPLGISFWTFQKIAFLCDSFQGETEDDFSRYAVFMAFFPQTIAGPIVHHREMMPQFARPEAFRWNPSHVGAGLAVFIIGLAKKTLIADTCAPWGNAVFGASVPPTILEAWVGLLAFTMQLYFDFSGYSDMAIGLGMMFNIKLPENFDAPYRSGSIIEFWRRWHMTLSRWLRDYLYITLGGNRYGETRRLLNLMLTMLIGGFWHGAAWTFVVWGGYHGALLVVNHLWHQAGWRMPGWVGRPLTFLAVMIGWAFFKATTLEKAWEVIVGLVDFSSFRVSGMAGLSSLEPLIVLPLLLVLVNVAPTTRQWVMRRPLRLKYAVGLALLFGLCLLAMRNVVLEIGKSEFIYFQF